MEAVLTWEVIQRHLGFPGGSDGKESACNAGAPGSIPGWGGSPGGGNGSPLLYGLSGEARGQRSLAGVHGVARVGHDLVT